MLKHRVITALIILPICLFLLFYLSPMGFASVTAAIALWGAWEWTYLMGIKTMIGRLLYLLLLVIATGLCQYLFSFTQFYSLVFIWWCLAILLIAIYPGGSFWQQGLIWRGVMGALVLCPFWISLNFLRNTPNGPYQVLFLFVIIWCADIGAYFCGRKWGKTKLAAGVSPGKTWEGVVGGMITALLFAICVLIYVKRVITAHDILFNSLLILLTVVFSIVGDLFESMIKRQAGVKDSGRLLPGHGGILDRIDSLTSAAPVYIFLTILLIQIG